VVGSADTAAVAMAEDVEDAGTAGPATREPVLAIGLMTGTSMDGIDAALVETDGRGSLVAGAAVSWPMDDALRRSLMAVAAEPAREHSNIEALSVELEELHAQAVEELLQRAGLDRRAVSVVGFHGQTLYHAPAPGRPGAGRTWQLGNGNRLAARLGMTVAWDFRSADVAAGGEGAPFAPAYHAAIARQAEVVLPVALLNIGGVANITWIGPPADEVSEPDLVAFDTGPGNALIDDWVVSHGLGVRDEGGQLAAAGQVDAAVLLRLMDHPYFRRCPPKSLDRFSFTSTGATGLSAADGAATLTAFTAESVAAAVDLLPAPPARWLVCGGGRHNGSLMAALRERLAVPVEPIDVIGFDGDGLEAQAFGYLAVRVMRRLPLSFPGTTGVPRPLPGGRLCRATG